MSPAPAGNKQQAHEHNHKSMRLRGGGAGKDCFLGLIGCCLCIDGCEDCCSCIADIICAYLLPHLLLGRSAPQSSSMALLLTTFMFRLPVRDVLLSI
jgi:hypothetical protein